MITLSHACSVKAKISANILRSCKTTTGTLGLRSHSVTETPRVSSGTKYWESHDSFCKKLSLRSSFGIRGSYSIPTPVASCAICSCCWTPQVINDGARITLMDISNNFLLFCHFQPLVKSCCNSQIFLIFLSWEKATISGSRNEQFRSHSGYRRAVSTSKNRGFPYWNLISIYQNPPKEQTLLSPILGQITAFIFWEIPVFL